MADAKRLEVIEGVFILAGRRGDVDALIQLNDRYDRLLGGRASPGAYSVSNLFGGPQLSMSQGMSACADDKMYANILRLLDYNLLTARRKSENPSASAAARKLRARYQSQGYFPSYEIWMGLRTRSIAITFPMMNEYLDTTAITALRTAYELYKRDDLLSDLIGHYRRQADTARTPADALYPRLALSSFLWWNDQREEAIAELTKVVEVCATRVGSEARPGRTS